MKKPRIFSPLFIWVLPPGEGSVKKVKISALRVVVAALIFGGLVGAALFVTGDYGRVQILRAKSEIWLYMVKNERDRLLKENKELEAQVATLKSANSSVLAYEAKVKDRIKTLSELLKSSTSLALLAPGAKGKVAPKVLAKSLKKDSNEDKQVAKNEASSAEKPGIGGPEFDCDPEKSSECAALQGISYLSDDSFEMGDLKALVARSRIPKSEGDMVHLLDLYIDLLSSIPLGTPTFGSKSSGFGLRVSPFHKGIKMHEGLDFSLASGSPIVATGNGTVAVVEYNSTYGNYVDIRHGDRVISRYAHMQRTAVKEGQILHRGDIIGYVGSTGRSTGPHLHYEVRVDGIARNPSSFLVLADRLGKLLL